MKITSRAEALRGEPMDQTHFTGPASSHPLHAAPEPYPVRVSVVHFEAGSRNHWHRHSGGQVLHVVEGEGLVQVRGEAPHRIGPGDTVATGPDEEHWHGAGSDGRMAHIAITIGEITWLEPAEADG